MNLRIKYVKPDTLRPYENNARVHSDEQVAQIARSIEEFGFTNPILISDDQSVIAGHGRLEAAKIVGMDKVPTITLSGLTEEKKRALILADNQIALGSTWDEETLLVELNDLRSLDVDVSTLGFDEEMIAALEADFSPASIEDQGRIDEVRVKVATCPKCGNVFDV